MNPKKRDQLQRATAKTTQIEAKRPKLGALLRIDGVVHECVSREGMGPWHWGGMWVPYETIHGHSHPQA